MMDVDVTIVGAGPAGLSCALTLGRAGRTVALLDTGAGRNRFAERSHGFLTRDGAAPADLRIAAQTELEQYKSVIRFDRPAVSASGYRGAFMVDTGGVPTTIRSRRVVIAQGVKDRLLDIPGFAENWGGTVFACPYCHGWEVRNRKLVMLGLSPLDYFHAELLTQWSPSVTLIATSTAGDASPHADLLARAGVEVVHGEPSRIAVNGKTCTAVDLADGRSVPAEAVVVHPPIDYASDVADDLGCVRLDDGAIEVSELGQTSVPGVSAAGDIARRGAAPAGMHFIARAVADGLNVGAVLNQELTFDDLHEKALV
ncbi:NAD(P)/FAD-dependent oxidoreductase [Rhodococcus maanshanensis]|uniref:NAD(P)/FAD-dependent oxidoreductase n=1 Tax=Rhodococcus maanshanensis TaxID=183556 RepID=UPI0022B40FFC|nr:NAD(P)/FAD-dependent oxidoreductase [Rhodococcus maanshanensis]MCZ4556597.1 NAD(P)/FAD-dependent oxidoreductase [Rhodococcus maanshanensis]